MPAGRLLDKVFWVCTRRKPEADPGITGEIISLGMRWKKWLGWEKSGLLRSVCCPLEPNVDGWMDDWKWCKWCVKICDVYDSKLGYWCEWRTGTNHLMQTFLTFIKVKNIHVVLMRINWYIWEWIDENNVGKLQLWKIKNSNCHPETHISTLKIMTKSWAVVRLGCVVLPFLVKVSVLAPCLGLLTFFFFFTGKYFYTHEICLCNFLDLICAEILKTAIKANFIQPLASCISALTLALHTLWQSYHHKH